MAFDSLTMVVKAVRRPTHALRYSGKALRRGDALIYVISSDQKREREN